MFEWFSLPTIFNAFYFRTGLANWTLGDMRPQMKLASTLASEVSTTVATEKTMLSSACVRAHCPSSLHLKYLFV